MRKGIQETDRSFYFTKMISKQPVTVSLRCGWIWIEENEGQVGPFGIFGSDQIKRMTLTTEDARNLIAAIQELIPKEETEKGSSEA